MKFLLDTATCATNNQDHFSRIADLRLENWIQPHSTIA